MSFRPDSRRHNASSKMTIRDMRLFLRITGEKNTEEKEGKAAPPPKVPSEPDPYQKFLASLADTDMRVKKRLKKMTEPKRSRQGKREGPWEKLGPCRATVTKNWKHYRGYRTGKSPCTAALTSTGRPAELTLDIDGEHPSRRVLCEACFCEIHAFSEDYHHSRETGKCVHESCEK